METSDFTQSVAQALRLWNDSSDEAPFEHLAFYQTLKRAYPYERPHQLTLRILEAGIQKLAQRNAAAASLLRQRFDQELMRKDVARTLSISIAHVDRVQRGAIHQLADILLEMEAHAQRELSRRMGQRDQDLRYRLDQVAAYDRLFGVDDLLQRLCEHLLEARAPFVIAVEGLGGIGKTSLAIESLRRVLGRADFLRFAFVTAQQQQLLVSGDHRPLNDGNITSDAIIAAIAEQLLNADELPSPATTAHLVQRMQQVLRQERGLIVVDNLETIQALDSLLPMLHALSDPAKVILTTRFQPSTTQPIHRLTLPELSQTAGLELLRHQIATANVTQLLAARDDDLIDIFQLVGGNPLALGLVVGQCHAHPLSIVLDDLLQARGVAVDHLYTFIYRRAWDHLGSAARRLLVAMLLIPPHGADLSLVSSVAGMDATSIHDSLGELVRCNLVSFHPLSFSQGVYSLHSLTRTFLHKQVLRWM